MDFTQAHQKLRQKNDLTADNMEELFDRIFTKEHADEEVRDFLVALHEKGECYEEILGAARYLRAHGKKAVCKTQGLLDCCGTGGDQKNTFNISTAVAFVVSGAGCPVAKHGNRAVSSRSGSADVLSELGINIHAPKEIMSRSIDEIGIGFLFAPEFYPLMKKVIEIRKSLPHKTIFNILGPLLNPAGAKHQIIGVFENRLCLIMAKVLKELGTKSALIVHADNGMDEFSLSCQSRFARLRDGRVEEYTFDPREAHYSLCEEEDLKGGTPAENAARLIQCLKGSDRPLDHTVRINAAWALVVANRAAHFREGLEMAKKSIAGGKALEKLELLRERAPV